MSSLPPPLLLLLLLLCTMLPHTPGAAAVCMKLDKSGKCPAAAFTKPPNAVGTQRYECAFSCSSDTACVGIHHSPSGDCTHVTFTDYLLHWSSAATCDGVTFLRKELGVIDASEKLQLSNCSQSSTYSGGVCGRAIDGNTDRVYGGNSCTHTTAGFNQWWQAETAAVANISAVVIYNRDGTDAVIKKLRNFQILVDGTVCAELNNANGFGIEEFPCQATGRTVRVQSRINEALHFCEIFVFGRV